MVFLNTHLKLEEFNFLMIIFFISERVLLVQGRREEAGLQVAAYSTHMHHRSPEGHPTWYCSSPGKWLSAGPTPYLLGVCGDRGGKERDNKEGDVGSGFPHTKGV